MKVNTRGRWVTRVDLGDEDEHRGVHQPAAQTLDQPTADELEHVRRPTPANSSPATKIIIPTTSGRVGPIRSLSRPATTVANSMPITNSENDQA